MNKTQSTALGILMLALLSGGLLAYMVATLGFHDACECLLFCTVIIGWSLTASWLLSR